MLRSLASLLPRVRSAITPRFARCYAGEVDPRTVEPRAVEDFDVVIVGGGPAGLSASIRLKQLAAAKNKELRVCVLEKAAEFGRHTMSGAVIEPRSLNELIPDWKEKGAPLDTPAKKDRFYYMTETSQYRMPLPKEMHNHGNYIVSLGNVVRWLSTQAEEAGVELYPGFPGAEVLYNDDGSVAGVATGDVGIGKKGEIKQEYARGMELRGKVTLFGEGCRGSLSRQLFKKFNLEIGEPQTYGLGIKELWEVPEDVHEEGTIIHTVGWPLKNVYQGTFMYHMKPNLISLGMAIGLDYPNPYMSPYHEFQRFKHHPMIKKILERGTCVEYGARALIEGGWQSLPKLAFPGGALIGDSAGFMNVPKVKGTHTSMKSGMLAAEQAFAEIEGTGKLSDYDEALRESWVGKELYSVRNFRPSFGLGFVPFFVISGMESLVTKGRLPFTLHHHGRDSESLKPAAECEKIVYPKPDGKISFDLLTNLQRANTNHEEDQPPHLKVTDPQRALEVSFKKYAGPEGRFCPAGVYEWVTDQASGEAKLNISAQNCIHCKTCDIKSEQHITWQVPEGGGGPNYVNM